MAFRLRAFESCREEGVRGCSVEVRGWQIHSVLEDEAQGVSLGCFWKWRRVEASWRSLLSEHAQGQAESACLVLEFLWLAVWHRLGFAAIWRAWYRSIASPFWRGLCRTLDRAVRAVGGRLGNVGHCEGNASCADVAALECGRVARCRSSDEIVVCDKAVFCLDSKSIASHRIMFQRTGYHGVSRRGVCCVSKPTGKDCRRNSVATEQSLVEG